MSAAVKAPAPNASMTTGMRNSPGVSVAVIGTVGSIETSHPAPPKLRPVRRVMTESGSTVKPAGMPAKPPKRTPTDVRTVPLPAGGAGASVMVTAPLTVKRYDQLPERNVRFTAPVFAKRPVSQ